MSRIKKVIADSDKLSLFFYVILRLIIVISLINQLFVGNIENVFLCILSLVLFMLPAFIKKKFKVVFPNVLEISIILFIFAAEILGTINNFYNIFPRFDELLHTVNGFLAASVGFSLIYLLNENLKEFKLSSFFVSLFAFCFSMTIGIMWEFFEYSADNLLDKNTQKDTTVYELKGAFIDDIDYTLVYGKDDEMVKIDGYLDIGLHDTMSDLIVNFIGAFICSIFGYLYMKNKDKYKVVDKFLIRRLN